jgi:hypothetical protein
MKKIIIFTFLLFQISAIWAVDKNLEIPKNISNEGFSIKDFGKNAAVGFHFGTTGVGFNYKTNITKRVFGRAGFSILPAAYKMPIAVSGLSTTASLSANLTNIHLLGELQIFERIGLRLVGGFSYFVLGDLKATLQPKSAYTIDNVTYTPSDIGQLQLNLDWSGLGSYAGLGFGMPIPESKLNVNMDLGLMYLSQPKATVIGTARLQDNAAMANQINKNISDYRYLPMFQLSINYKLN